jgi:serine/threonine-protein kinase HipA
MDQSGNWSLSPAFDMTYSYNPTGRWTSTHQMSLNSKREDFIEADFTACEKVIAMKRGRGLEILQEVQDAVVQWPAFAADAGVPLEAADQIASTHRTTIYSPA